MNSRGHARNVPRAPRPDSRLPRGVMCSSTRARARVRSDPTQAPTRRPEVQRSEIANLQDSEAPIVLKRLVAPLPSFATYFACTAAMEMTKAELRAVCKKLNLYSTAYLNDKLYLHYRARARAQCAAAAVPLLWRVRCACVCVAGTVCMCASFAQCISEALLKLFRMRACVLVGPTPSLSLSRARVFRVLVVCVAAEARAHSRVSPGCARRGSGGLRTSRNTQG